MFCIIKKIIIWRTIVFILILVDQCTSHCEEEITENNLMKIPTQYTETFPRILVICHGIDLPLEPVFGQYSQLFSNYQRILKIKDSHIPLVPSSAFLEYSDVRILYIENQGIKTIHPDAFYNMNNLEELYLSENELQQIAGIFDSLQQLKILDLSNNLIKDVPVRCFDKLANLRILNLSFNKVFFFPDSMLEKNIYLEHIDLSFNEISKINVGTIAHSINSIDLSNNQIDEFNYGLFNFNNLNLSSNKITILKFDEMFSSLVQTTHFDLSYNEISQIDSNFFSILKNLHYLNLGHNNISNIPPELFFSMNDLVDLRLSHNKFEKILEIFHSSLNLEILDLSNNIIRYARPYCFKELVNLKTLNMSSNKLTAFSDSLFNEKVRLKYVDLSFNNISKLNIGTIITHDIDNLDLSNNKIDEFSPSFFNSINVNMSRNELRNLEVDESSSSSWITIDLDLSFNKISELESTFIVNMTHLQFLNLGHNNISNIPYGFFSRLNELIYLNLSYNHLKQFQHGVFDNLFKLRILDISHNELKEIEKYLHSLSTLRELNIDSNMLNSLDSARLRSYVPGLIKLSLEKNNFTCDSLTNIVHYFRQWNGSMFRISRGSNTSTSNVFGIACIDENSIKGTTEGSGHMISPSKNVFNGSDKLSTELHKNDAMFNYFNEDFLNSNFYKYMENLSNSHPIKINETGIYNYFNEDFKNSEFFKYMENFRNEHDSSSRFHDGVYRYFNSDFRNSSFVKFFESLRAHEELMNAGFKNSIMYNFFNKDFKNSDFYKYSRNMSCPLAFSGNSKSDNNFNVDKLIYAFESSKINISAISVATLILLVIIVLLLICIVYNNSLKGHSSRRERIELLNA